MNTIIQMMQNMYILIHITLRDDIGDNKGKYHIKLEYYDCG